MANEEDIVQRIVLEGDKVVIEQFKNIEKAGTKAFEDIQKSAKAAASGGGFGALSGVFNGLQNSFRQVQSTARAMGKEFTNLGNRVRNSARNVGIFTAAGTALTGVLLGIARSAANFGDNIKDTAEGLNLSVEKFQALAASAALAGISQEKFARGQQRGIQAAEAAGDAQKEFDKNVVKLRRDLGLGRITVDQFNQTLGDMRFALSQVDDPFKELGADIVRARDGSIDWERTQRNLADALQKTGINSSSLSQLTKIYGRDARKFALVLKDGAAGLDEQEKEAKRLGLTLSKDVINRLGDLADEFDRVGQQSKNTAATVTAVFAPTLQRALRAILEDGARTRAGIIKIATDIANKLVPIVDDLIALLEGRTQDIHPDSIILKIRDAFNTTVTGIDQAINNILIPAFKALMVVLNTVAQFFNGIFGTNISGAAILISALILKLTGTFGIFLAMIKLVALAVGGLVAILGGPLTVALLAISVLLSLGIVKALKNIDWAGFVNSAVAAFDAVLAYITGIVTAIQNIFTAFLTWLGGLWTGLKNGFNSVWIFVSDMAKVGVDYIVGVFTSMGEGIIAVWQRVKNFIIDVWNSVKGKIAAMTQGAGSSAAGAQGYKTGGPIRGPGTGTSDSVLMWGSAGEFMQPYAAVKKYGLAFMESIRTLRFNPDGFNMGGLVGFNPPQPSLRLADGGPVGGGRKNVLNLTIGNETFGGLGASDDTMDQLTRYATGKQLRSAGRKPGWRS